MDNKAPAFQYPIGQPTILPFHVKVASSKPIDHSGPNPLVMIQKSRLPRLKHNKAAKPIPRAFRKVEM